MSNEVSRRCILHVDDTNKVSSYKRNNYAMQSLLAIGGGAVEKLNTRLDSYRVGGSTTDKYNYINGYVDNSTITKQEISVSIEER